MALEETREWHAGAKPDENSFWICMGDIVFLVLSALCGRRPRAHAVRGGSVPAILLRSTVGTSDPPSTSVRASLKCLLVVLPR